MYYLRNFDKQADAVGQKAYLPTIAIVGGVNKVGYFDGDASKDSVFTEDGDFINVGEKETRVVCTYNVTSTTEATKICYYTTGFTSMEVDGTEVTLATEYTTFTTTGEHIVKYTLKDATTLGDSMFELCSDLTSVVIPESVTSIGYSAFKYCDGLTSITIPDSVTSIADSAFEDCAGLTSITIPNSVTSIGNYAFSECAGLTSITIPNSVTSIGGYAFDSTPWYQSYSANTANQYGNIIYINNVAYQATSTGITSCEFKEGTTYIAGCTFYNCTGLTSVVIPDSVTSIGYAIFYGCSGLTSVTIGSGVTTIGEAIFYGCSGLTSVTIGSGVTEIGNSAFNTCTSLTSITIPDSVTSIGNSAFNNCTSLTSITIPDSVTSIGNSAFNNCTTLETITYNGTVAQWKAITRRINWHSNVKATKITCSDGTCGLDDK
jgi:hypothetical protein